MVKVNNIQHALNLCNQQRFDEALPVLERIIKDEPKNSEAWRLIAQVHWLHKNDTKKACDELIEALKIDPKNLSALILMGNLLTKDKNDFKTAKKYYDKVLEYYPDSAIAINNIGATFMELKDYESALPYFEKAIKIDDSYVNCYYGLALCYYKLNRLEDSFNTCHQGALKSVDRPENPSVRDELIKLYISVAKALSDRTNYLKVWKEIKDELEHVDHVNIRITEDKDINALAKLEYAPLHAAKEHVIRYNPDKDFVEHIFIHEMMHLKMNQQAAIANRSQVVISSNETRAAFKRRFLKFMQNTHKHIGNTEIEKVMNGLAEGLGLQLMNSPLDLFVEHMIYTDYKVVRPIQMLSLFHMEQDNINSVRQATKNGFFPKEIVFANKVMNIATSLHFKEIFGINLIGQYKPTRQEYEQAQDLYEEFKAYLDTYKAGDEYELIEYFAESFNMEDLIEITDENQVSSGMKADLSMMGDLKDLKFEALSREEADVANAEFAKNHKDGADPTETMMMAMYMLAAMEFLDNYTIDDVHRIAIEIAMEGVKGIDPKKNGYSIKSLPGKQFGGYEFLAYYYVSWARAIPEKLNSLGLPFSNAYDSALQMYNAKHTN